MTVLCDSWQRQINYLRISVTDRCNLNCIYCSEGDLSTQARLRSENLTYEEINRIVEVAATLGITKVRLTGGEPLVRSDLSRLVEMLSRIKGIDDIALTTNGMLLGQYAPELKKAGLKRVNVSLDTLQPDKFQRITGTDNLKDVFAGIEAARINGLNPVKINMVVLRGINDDEIIDFARLTIDRGWHIRFIEFMPLGKLKNEVGEMVSGEQIRERIQKLGHLEPDTGKGGDGPARYYRFTGAEGTIGFISPMTQHFCHSCNRLRLTADGQLRPCLLDDDEVDLRAALRNGAKTEELTELIRRAVALKQEEHHLDKGIGPAKRSMRGIGG
ncbi:MAG: GTP 3',8-cyclase MoaA [Dehalococcoidales bacterium]|nr:GTP 3',8-cyclase MoaA [Dehalococcoidales bacterium]